MDLVLVRVVSDPPTSADVLVIGAGPAGALAARALARAGTDVVLIDRETFPRWKVCGCCVGGGGAAALEAEGLGTLLDDLGATRPDTLVIESAGRSVRLPLGATRVVSRTALDHALVEAARTAGARVHTGWTARIGGIDDGHHLTRRRAADRDGGHARGRSCDGAIDAFLCEKDRPAHAPVMAQGQKRCTEGFEVRQRGEAVEGGDGVHGGTGL